MVLEDSSYDRNRRKSVELLTRCFDHTSQKMCFYDKHSSGYKRCLEDLQSAPEQMPAMIQRAEKLGLMPPTF